MRTLPVGSTSTCQALCNMLQSTKEGEKATDDIIATFQFSTRSIYPVAFHKDAREQTNKAENQPFSGVLF